MSKTHALHDVLFPLVDAALAEADAAMTLSYFRPLMTAGAWDALCRLVAGGVPDATMDYTRNPVARAMREAEMLAQAEMDALDYHSRRRAVAAVLLNVLRRDGVRQLHRLATSLPPTPWEDDDDTMRADLRRWAFKILRTPRRRKAVAYAILTLLDSFRWSIDHLEPRPDMSAMAVEQRRYNALRENLRDEDDDMVLLHLQGGASIEVRATNSRAKDPLDSRGVHRATSIGRKATRWAWCGECEKYFAAAAGTTGARCTRCEAPECAPPERTHAVVQFHRAVISGHTVYTTFTKSRRGWVLVAATVEGSAPRYYNTVVSTTISDRLERSHRAAQRRARQRTLTAA